MWTQGASGEAGVYWFSDLQVAGRSVLALEPGLLTAAVREGLERQLRKIDAFLRLSMACDRV